MSEKELTKNIAKLMLDIDCQLGWFQFRIIIGEYIRQNDIDLKSAQLLKILYKNEFIKNKYQEEEFEISQEIFINHAGLISFLRREKIKNIC